MASVTIKGSITPSSRLARGQEITVQDTPEVRRFIAAGWADLVAEHADAPTGGTFTLIQGGQSQTFPHDANDPDKASPASTTIKPPAKNASREDWAEFLANFPGVSFVTEDKGRDALIGEWEKYEDEHPEA